MMLLPVMDFLCIAKHTYFFYKPRNGKQNKKNTTTNNNNKRKNVYVRVCMGKDQVAIALPPVSVLSSRLCDSFDFLI